MNKSNAKTGLQVAVIVLAAIILFVLAGIVLLFLVDKSVSPIANSSSTEKTKLTASGPSKKELEIDDQIVITSNEKNIATPAQDQPAVSRTQYDYIIPDSDIRLLTNADIAGLTKTEINYAKNEIYARHGRMFKSHELQNYFNSKSWYVPLYDSDDFDRNYSAAFLSDVEKKNAEFLKNAENMH